MKKVKYFLNKKIWKFPVIDWAALVGGLALFAAVCLTTITKCSIWFDEAFGAYMIKFNLADIAHYTSLDVHPPLFYWCLKGWAALFGHTELGLRSMSVFFGCVAIFFGYLLIYKLFNRKTANLSLLFMVVSPMLVRYGQEMRMYTMVAAIATAATYVLTVAMESKKKTPWIIYGILVALGLWTHYFIVIVWFAHWVWRATVLWHETGRKRFLRNFFSKTWIGTHVLAIALFAAWLPNMFNQIFVVQTYGFWISPVTANTFPNFFTNYLYYLDSDQTSGWLATAFLSLLILLFIFAVKIYRTHDETWRKSYRLIASVAFVPLVFLFLLSMPPLRSYFIDRYLIASVLFMTLFIGVTLSYGLDLIRSKLKYIVVIFVVGLMIFGISNVWTLGNFNKNTNNGNNARGIIQAAQEASSEADEPIISSGLYIFYEESFYSTNDHTVYFVAPSNYESGSLTMLKENSQYKITNIDEFVKNHDKVWYVGWCKGDVDGFKAPYGDWTKLREITVKESPDGEIGYKAIEYQTH